MTRTIRDAFTIELNQHLRFLYPRSRVHVVYERIEEVYEPEEGPCVYDIDLPRPLVEVLEKRGIRNLYKFQFEAYKRVLNGENVVISAGTGMGKTEAFFLPIAKKALEEIGENPKVLLLYPTKALARDQVKRFSEYLVYGKLGVSIYDGDTPENVRKKIALNPPPVIVSNPDMIHTGLVFSPYIRNFVKNTRTLVFDELHVYDGVLGAHLHHLVHRIKAFRREKTQIIASSATIGNPKEFAESLFEESFVEIKGPARRKGSAVHVFISTGYMDRLSVILTIVKFLTENGKRFLVFVDSQQFAELLTAFLIGKLGVKVSVHRAGLPYDHRRDVEQKLREGLLDGVIATPTLELGIDVGVLDAVVLATLPPSYTRYIQRAGRAGRRGKGYVITVLGNDPIEAYYTRNPEKFFEQKLPPSVIEPYNEEVSKLHLVAYTLQLGKANIHYLPKEWKLVVEDLVLSGVLKRVGPYVIPIYGAAYRFFSERQSIRSFSEQIVINDYSSGSTIGTRELPIAILELYPDAVYYHGGKPHRVVRLDLEERVAVVRRIENSVHYYTRPLYDVDVADYVVYDERSSELGVAVSYAKVLLKEVVYGYVMKDLENGRTIYVNELEAPVEYKYVTKAVLIKFPEIEGLDIVSSAEAFHAIEHGLISASSITCGAGLTELGGISYPSGDIIVYDATIGGSGLAKLLYNKLEDTLGVTYEIMSSCTCEDGCPQCVYSPYCGNNNRYLSRKKGLYVLEKIYLEKLAATSKPLIKRYGKPIV
ncbi:MAG: DEAD/DEAH box helicase [Desulfurococcaceae archaeon]